MIFLISKDEICMVFLRDSRKLGLILTHSLTKSKIKQEGHWGDPPWFGKISYFFRILPLIKNGDFTFLRYEVRQGRRLPNVPWQLPAQSWSRNAPHTERSPFWFLFIFVHKLMNFEAIIIFQSFSLFNRKFCNNRLKKKH